MKYFYNIETVHKFVYDTKDGGTFPSNIFCRSRFNFYYLFNLRRNVGEYRTKRIYGEEDEKSKKMGGEYQKFVYFHFF